MKTSDLHRKWADVLDMCEGTSVNPCSAWKFKGYIQDDKLPNFEYDKPECFEFLVAILEDKPVFVGDEFYEGGGNKCTIKADMHLYVNDYCIVQHVDNVDWPKFSWNPPKKTFMLNGEYLPCPDGNKGGYQIGMFSERYYFTDFHDAQKVAQFCNKTGSL